MSKLITGHYKITGLDVVVEACGKLGWTWEQTPQGMRVRVVDAFAQYRPFIDVQVKDGRGELTYDHWMGLGTAQGQLDQTTDMDQCTARVIGQFKQACARVQVERLLKKQRASWRVEQRVDGAQVFVVRRGR